MCTEETHPSLARSKPQHVHLVQAEAFVGSDSQGVLCLRPSQVHCEIRSQFAGRDLITKEFRMNSKSKDV